MNIFTNDELEKLYALRHQLHKHPEISGHEKQTAKKIESFISRYNPGKIIRDIGGNGIAFVYGNDGSKPVVMFRADMDGLPINEDIRFEYASVNKGVSHKCGHDGHMTILCGVAVYLHKNPPKNHKVILLFQPGEETGKGAEMVLKDPGFSKIKPGYMFAMHNLPGFAENSIVLKRDVFASASTGIIINLEGESSHAAHPEHGNSPSRLTAELILEIEQLPKTNDLFDDFVLVTVVHARIGEIAFGTNPGKAEVMATLRTFRNDDMSKLKNLIEEIVNRKAERYQIRYSISYTEEFPTTTNHNEAMLILEKAVDKLKKEKKWIDKPFRWSEDFGNFAKNYKTTMWGLGSGVDHPSLHNSYYDFNDNIIETGVSVFVGILKEL